MVTIVYWSGTGNTEAMANEIEAAAKGAANPKLTENSRETGACCK